MFAAYIVSSNATPHEADRVNRIWQAPATCALAFFRAGEIGAGKCTGTGHHPITFIKNLTWNSQPMARNTWTWCNGRAPLPQLLLVLSLAEAV